MKSHISGIQIPTAARINIDGGLTLDAQAGNSGEMLISQGANVTPIWSNTLTSPTIITSLLTSSTSFNLLTTTATTINFGLAATTMNIATNNVAKTINLGTGASGGNQTDINIGTSASATTSNINLYGQTILGKPVTSATTASGFGVTLTSQGTSGTGTSGNATGANFYIYSGAASLTNASNLAGVATSGNLILDTGSATVAYFDGTAAYGNIQIGTGNASAVTIGKTGITTTINGTATFPGSITSTGDISTGGKLQSTASSGDEGGEIFLNKSVTNTTLNGGVTIDVWQNRLRFFEQGGTARGFYIDVATGGAGVATNLANALNTQGYGWTGFQSGYYYNAQGGAQTNATPTLNTMTLVPFVLSVSATFTKIGIYVNTAGTAGAVVRLGIYNSSNGLPGTRLLDAGTVATTTSSSLALITINQTLSPGLYWLAAVPQTATCSAQCKGAGFVPMVPFNGSPANSNARGFQVASVSGALPTPAGTLAMASTPFEVFLQL